MTIPPRMLEELERRRRTVIAGGGADKLAARHEKGLLGARERLEHLFQPGTFQETGMHVRHNAHHFGLQDKDFPADGVITGTGYVGAGLVAAYSQDFTVNAGTLGKAHASKIVALMQFALKNGVPIVSMQDSGGARIQEAVDALSGYGEVFYHNVLASGVVPQIALVLGPCAGGAAYSPALNDFIIMTRRNAHMFITGPEVIKAVTGRSTTMDEVGSAEMHASVSGNVHFIAEDDTQAVALAAKLLSYLPPNNTMDPPHRLNPELVLAADEGMNALVPEDPAEPMDVRQVIARLVDGGELLEVHASWARNIVVGFARLQGMVIGLVANQPAEMAGALDINASDKAARFIRFCNAFNVPVVTLVDVPGFLPGVEQERGGIIRHGAKLLFAYASCTTPKLTVILRKAYGGSYLAMCSQEMGADVVYAWPNAEIAVMGAQGAVNLLYRKELGEAEDRAARAAELIAGYRAEFASPYLSAARGYITDVIAPSETRAQLALSLRKILNKRELRPAKKHGNVPL
ncbi:methylmalonyl-CoA carboxyltransferase [Rubrivivax gelatinosus]|uniref:Methylmalonyl-CoA carboxyltransferase n=1 Tax=Rubrivivax gelatinosus TaxID=28068 RepID=A0ABS1DWZ0_RUBGE|nr:acyl-CoA carboxylase subunit beta [Rubrivivax gelatinosus]MBK1613244.1 methylmalonyl-CoA carboxyltransferase [Rubrivivax gelatinosus]MBK1714562.1 methylmalonyl-CoA carboxyltransferase [Rubrivivax gelatinosus]